MAKKKFYTVRVGKVPGVYSSWADCQAQTKGFSGAEFKSFATKEMADDALINGWGDKAETIEPTSIGTIEEPVLSIDVDSSYIQNSISVDAACSGNPGAMEFQGVHTQTGETLFVSKVFPIGTNNIGEFLALVEALRYSQENKSELPIYTDSISAIAWVRKQRVNTSLKRDVTTEALWSAVDNAIAWLQNNEHTTPILKWNTTEWGESKADYGRK